MGAHRIFARTDLGVSVYNNLILDDAPEVYWRLDETKTSEEDATLVALNHGTAGSAANGTYVGPPELGGETLVVRDPGTSMDVTNTVVNPGTSLMGVYLNHTGLDVFSSSQFVVEAWCIPAFVDSIVFPRLWEADSTSGGGLAHVVWEDGSIFNFAVQTTTSTYNVTTGALATNNRYHVVAKFVTGETLKLWVNGTLYTGPATAGTTTNQAEFRLGHMNGSAEQNWVGPISHVAIWRGAAAQAIDQTWVDAHYAAGTAPWQGDLPGARLDRVLDLAGWPAALREIDDGVTTLQSASFE